MADENSPSNTGSSFPKKETVRITLPPRMNEAPAVKRETVRIAQNPSSDKGQTIRIQPKNTGEPQPKKETTKIVSLGSLPPPPVVALPPKPAGIPSPPPPKPPTGAFSMPPAKPSINPVSPPAPPVSAPAAPVAPKPNAPKKETSRIQIPLPTSRMQMPKATVKLQQTQPLPQGPAASVIKTSTLSTSTGPIAATAEDPLVLVASIAIFIGSAAAAVLSYLTFSACA